MVVVFSVVWLLFLLGVGFFVVALPFYLYGAFKHGEIDVNHRPIRRKVSPVLFWVVWVAGCLFWLIGARQFWIMVSNL